MTQADPSLFDPALEPDLEAGHPPMKRDWAPLRSIAALILREMSTRFGNKPGGYIWALVQPLFMIIILAFAFSLLMRTPSLGTSFILFKGTGLLVLSMFRTVASTVGRSMGFSKALLSYPGVTWLDAAIARFVLNALVILIVTWIILTGTIIVEDIQTVLNWPKIALAMALAMLLGFGMGLLNCYLFQRFPVWENTWAIITSPLFIISGVILLYEDMPYLAQQVLWYNPMLHVTGIMRDAFYPTYRPEYISVLYVLFWALIPMLMGLLLLRRHHRTLLQR